LRWLGAADDEIKPYTPAIPTGGTNLTDTRMITI
jgi:hypothetical protein